MNPEQPNVLVVHADLGNGNVMRDCTIINTPDGIATHRTGDDRWVVSDRGMWLEGIYDSHATARRAVGFTDAQLHALGRIYRIDGEDRPVTMSDLDALESDTPTS